MNNEDNDNPVLNTSFVETKYIPVQGYKDFARDVRTGAIVNINSSSHMKAVRTKRENLAKKQELDTLKQEMSEIKDMLSQLLNKVNNTNGSN